MYWLRKSRLFFGKLRHQAKALKGSKLSRAVRRANLTYCSAAKIERLEQCVDRAISASVPGAVVEFGVALGGSAVVLANRCAPRAFHGFDVFGMIPPPQSDKDDRKSKERYEVIASGCSEGIGGELYYGYRSDLFVSVMNTFAEYGCPADNSRVFLHKGFFQDTWASFPAAERICVAHIDCDWYDSVSLCIRLILPRLCPGSMIVFDDYHDYGGAKTAVDELLDQFGQAFDFDFGENVILTANCAIVNVVGSG